jgi:hypothetical protein
VIDQEKRGYIEPEKLAGLLSSLGEPFSDQEIEEMFAVAVNPEKGMFRLYLFAFTYCPFTYLIICLLSHITGSFITAYYHVCLHFYFLI